jgi:small ligand-binding sensory domain FIST
MKIANALTTQTNWEAAAADLSRQAGDGPWDSVWVFAHSSYREQLDDILESLHVGLRARQLTGCTAAGIIGAGHEMERQPAIALLAAELPGTELKAFHVDADELDEATGPAYWHFLLATKPEQQPSLLVLADPFTIPTPKLVQSLTEAYPGAVIAGGLSSGGTQPGECRVFLDGRQADGGAVVLVLTGHVALRAVVSTGCKPVGEPLTITRADRNIIFELGGRPPLAVLQEFFPQLPPSDQQLVQKALVLGRVVNEYKDEYAPEDFVIRNLLQFDQQSGAVAVGDFMRTGQTVQFQVRDGQRADADLRLRLAQTQRTMGAFRPRGALLFSCLGRGEGMFGTRHHDVQLLREALGPLPTAGFFGNGEIGPVGDRAHVHGFTSVIGLLGETGN